MYWKYLDLVGHADDCYYIFRQVFRSKDISRLIYKNKTLCYFAARFSIVSLLKTIAGNDINIGLHSLRSGANVNVNNRCLKRHDRWKTDSAKDGYAVDSVEKRLNISKAFGWWSNSHNTPPSLCFLERTPLVVCYVLRCWVILNR